MSLKIQCAHCRRFFDPNPRVKNQCYCSRKDCQRARKNRWQKHKLATDPDYRDNQRECQKAWQDRNPDYWRNYRRRHPQYVKHNRIRQRLRNRGRRRRIAKMDAYASFSNITSGTYYLVPSCDPDGVIAKMDASAQKVLLIPVS
jgi:hypothetical protein